MPTISDTRPGVTRAEATGARVTAVYPSGPVLPENTLRFYVHFSEPMAAHRAADFVYLCDDSGRPDRAAFMKFKQELWSADRTRLTMLVDPGRIKRGVSANFELGPALIEGQRYSLVVGGGWPSADGTSSLAAFAKPFEVGPALRRQPAVGQWSRTSPAPGTREPLVVSFDRPFDRHLLSDAIDLVGPSGRRLDGTVRIGRHEESWSFTPTEAWPADALGIRVADFLEDVAGNDLRELLDREIEGT